MQNRLTRIYPRLAADGLNGLLLTWSPNISYLCRHQSRDSFLVLLRSRAVYLTDGRYTAEAKRALGGQVEVIELKANLFAAVAALCRKARVRRLGIESNYLSYAQYRVLRRNLGRGIQLVPTTNLIEGLRLHKEPQEIARIKKAVAITIAALGHIQKFLTPGITELRVAAELQRFIRYQGADQAAFEIIVASGPNASFPHHQSSGRPLRHNEGVLIDLGVDWQGYKSDLTKVFFLGKINALLRKIYTVARDAQEKALATIRPGVALREIDRAARQWITQAGYGKFFSHSSGHGVGLEVHEQPRIWAKSEGFLEPGMVFTVEPGIYLANRCGVRIEDMVLITTSGYELLSGDLNRLPLAGV